jgi:hypothetical protein
MAMGVLVLVPAMLGARGLRTAVAAAAAGQALALAPLRRPIAQASEHVEDRVAELRAEMHAAAEETRGAPLPQAEDTEIVAGRLAGAADLPPPRVAIAHSAGRRLRLSPRAPLDAATLEALAAALAAFPGVTRATLRRGSDSLVIEAAMPADTLAARLARAGLVEIEGRSARPLAAEAAAATLGWLDGLIRLRSRGAAGLDEAIAMGVVVAGLLRRDPAFAGCEPSVLVARALGRRSLGRGRDAG